MGFPGSSRGSGVFLRLLHCFRFGQYMPEICAVDAERPGDSITKELSTKRFCGDSRFKKLCDHRSCKEKSRSSVKEICSAERVTNKFGGIGQ